MVYRVDLEVALQSIQRPENGSVVVYLLGVDGSGKRSFLKDYTVKQLSKLGVKTINLLVPDALPIILSGHLSVELDQYTGVEELSTQFRTELEAEQNWVLVLENASIHSPLDKLIPARGGIVIVTTSATEVCAGKPHVVNVSPLSQSLGSLLLTEAGCTSPKAASLVPLLAGHPLALYLAARLLSQVTTLDVDTFAKDAFLSATESSAGPLLPEILVKRVVDSMFRTLVTVHGKEAAGDMAAILGLISVTQIGVRLPFVRKAVHAFWKVPLEKSKDGRFSVAYSRLMQFGLVAEQSGAVLCHQLVRQASAASCPHLLSLAETVFDVIMSSWTFTSEDHSTWSSNTSDLLHSLVAWGVVAVKQKHFQDQTLEHMVSVCQFLEKLGLLETSLKCRLELLNAINMFGFHHPLCLPLVQSVAPLLQAQNRLEESLDYYQFLLQIQHHRLSANDPQLCVTLNCIGELQMALEKFDDAGQSFNETLQILQTMGEKQELSARIVALNNLGTVSELYEQSAEAASYFSESLELQKIHSSEPQSEAARLSKLQLLSWTSNKLAGCQFALGNLVGALRLYEDALTLLRAEKQLPATLTTELAITLNGMGDIFDAQNRVEDAIAKKNEALQLYLTLLTPEDAYLASLMNSLAASYYAVESYSQAMHWYREAEKIELANDDQFAASLTRENIKIVGKLHRMQMDDC